MNLRSLAIAAVCVASIGSVAVACSNTGDEPENNRIGPIDGPATVNDDVGADQDGADQDGAPPVGPSDGDLLTSGS